MNTTWVLPTFHPAHILRKNRKLEGLLKHDLKRAVGLSNKSWHPKLPDESTFILRPTAEQVVTTLASMHGGEVAYDIETNGEHPVSKSLDIRCIGFYDGKVGLNVPFLFRDGATKEVVTIDKKGKSKVKAIPVWKPYFGGETLERVRGAIQRLFDSGGSLITQNGQYDRLCLRARMGLNAPWGGRHADTILMHHIVASYLPHGLDLLTSVYTDMPYYKKTEEGTAWSTNSDRELALYCVRDCYATWLSAKKLKKEITERAEDKALYVHDARQEHECEEWKLAGIEVDEEALALFRQHYSGVAAKALLAMKEIVVIALGGSTKRSVIEIEQVEKSEKEQESAPSDGVMTGHQITWEEKGIRKTTVPMPTDPLAVLLERLQGAADEEEVDDFGAVVEKFNPASLLQLRALLIGIDIPLSAETATGLLSTAEEFLLTARKELLGQKVAPTDDRLAFLDALFSWRASTKIKSTYLAPELIEHEYTGVNGGAAKRVHPTFSVHVVPSGRLASKQPNFTNQPASIRGMFVARPNHTLVYIDWDAVEMRLGAFLSGDQTFIKDFAAWDARTGPKIHAVNMCGIFGLPLVDGIADKHPAMYRAAKVFAYACAYGAGPTTTYEQVRAEMPDMTFPDFLKVYEQYKKFRKRLFEYMKDVVRRGTQNQCLDSAILGRRVYFFERVFGEDSPEASAMQNMPFQSTTADVVGLANFRILDRVVKPMQKELKPGEVLQQLAQIHDELLFEVPERLAKEFGHRMKTVAEGPPGPKYASWSLPVDLKCSKRWKPIKWSCVHCEKSLKNKVELELARRNVTVGKGSKARVISLWTGKCDVCKKTTEVKVLKGEAHHEEEVRASEEGSKIQVQEEGTANSVNARHGPRDARARTRANQHSRKAS